jgi:hypothetical protein
MPILPFRWFAILVGLFLVAVGVDQYFTSAKRTGVQAAASEAITVTAFMDLVRTGELSAGRIVYRTNAAGLADLAATMKSGEVAKTIRTTARVTLLA